MGNDDRISAGFFGNGNGNRWRFATKIMYRRCWAKGETAGLVSFRRTFVNIGNVLQKYGFAIIDADDDFAGFTAITDKTGQP